MWPTALKMLCAVTIVIVSDRCAAVNYNFGQWLARVMLRFQTKKGGRNKVISSCRPQNDLERSHPIEVLDWTFPTTLGEMQLQAS